ncbi:MAG TPA: sugar ABC transporter permease [Paraburkholderia sp.]|uniref:sugar ABC transporter permease n=1 Tax=Paraburkholderia sp. TaxID=1926495 RepID=UPI002DF4FCF2|nr:sugar ABC transporter permease [Paraburkholderia sp.]
MAVTKQRRTSHHVTVQMVVRVATHHAQLARCLLHGLLGDALGIHTIDIDRRRELACLHVELERARVPDAMALLIRTLPGAEFGAIRRLDRGR